jgi:hypothetical protein
MLRRVALVRSDVSEELIVSIISVTRVGEAGTTLAVTSNRLTLPHFVRIWLTAFGLLAAAKEGRAVMLVTFCIEINHKLTYQLCEKHYHFRITEVLDFELRTMD